ncbi:hypothetical protein [Ancylobacter dichloromethanicus]|uniref:Lipoprotein n=1 Tax=Ancylobacter dichloromethanicus TaxID=518825 RepID=A0A9W6N078_9HYPH|nr:hypothetical protein [Ancylobacter dichloromethanicus]GLK72775.1 hypothetical protein GCM10017643_28910 [Ancylobacter dichloromethanicus]
MRPDTSSLPSRLRRALLLVPVLGLTLAAAGCETLDSLNPFNEREKPLPGPRTPVFPEGVPGVDYNQPPPQPANSSYNPYQTEPPAEGTATAADAGAASPQ